MNPLVIKYIQKFKSMAQKRPERLGIDFEAGIARIVRLTRLEDGSYVLAAFGHVHFDPKNFSTDDRKRFLGEILRVGGGLRHVAVNVEDPSLRIRRMVLPKMPDEDMREAIKWNFREHIDVPIEKYMVGYIPMRGVVEGNKVAVVAYGVAKGVVDDYSNKFRSMRLKLVSLEPVASALLASLHVNSLLDDEGYHVCILFEEEVSYFSICRKDLLLFSRPLAGISHEAFVKSINRDLNVDDASARKMIEEWMSNGSEGAPPAGDLQGKFQATTKHFFSKLVIEIQRSIDAFCIQCGVEKIDKIHVCGYGAIYPDLTVHMRTTLGIPTEIFDPLSKLIDKNRVGADLQKTAPFYAVAAGLAMS